MSYLRLRCDWQGRDQKGEPLALLNIEVPVGLQPRCVQVVLNAGQERDLYMIFNLDFVGRANSEEERGTGTVTIQYSQRLVIICIPLMKL